MRRALQKLAAQRLRFCGCAARQGFKTYRSHTVPTLLLAPVWTLDGQFVAGHVWMNLTRALQRLSLQPEDWGRSMPGSRRIGEGARIKSRAAYGSTQ